MLPNPFPDSLTDHTIYLLNWWHTVGFPGLSKRNEWFAIDYSGRFWIEEPGDYRFVLTSDDGSRLYIDDHLAIDNDGLHGSVERNGEIALAAGTHPLTVLFFQKGGDIDLEVSWEGPGITRQPLPPDVLCHEK